MSTGAIEPSVTVAVVSWNTRDLLLRCLRSLEPDADAGMARVWVVDNGSSDGSLEAGREAAPWAEFVDPGGNLGFGRAVNLVAQRSSSTWIAAANADVAVEPGALAALVGAGAAPSVGCVAPRLVLPNGKAQHSVYPFPTVSFTLAFNLGLLHRSADLADRYCLEGYWNPDRERDVPWAIGAFLLIRRRAFEQIGGFDEDRWMYAEDLDLGWRLERRDWVTRYVPSARVHHDASAAADAAFGDAKTARFMTATYATIRRRRGRVRMWAVALLNVAGAAARVALSAPPALFSSQWRQRRDESRHWLHAHLAALRAGP